MLAACTPAAPADPAAAATRALSSMSPVSAPPILHYRLTHADQAPLPTMHPTHGTPLIAGGAIAFRPGARERWVPESDGVVHWELRGPGDVPLWSLQADYLEVARGHYTLPVGPVHATPWWRAETRGDELRLVRRPAPGGSDPRHDEPWFLGRVDSFDFVRDAAPFPWPGPGVSGEQLLPQDDEDDPTR